jgi:molybdenum cofactor cytidylyltransferase
VPLERGGARRALAAWSARGALDAKSNVLAVIPPGASDLRAALEAEGCAILESADTARGLGASLAAGVRHARDADGWIVALGDMPFIASATFAAVARALRDGALIAAPVHRGTRGHPVAFSGRLLAELETLDGDEGARSVILRHREDVVLVAVDDAGVTRDIDAPSDLPP